MRKKQILEQLAALKDQLKTDERRLQLAAAEGQEVKPEEVTALHTTEDKITALEAELKGIEDLEARAKRNAEAEAKAKPAGEGARAHELAEDRPFSGTGDFLKSVALAMHPQGEFDPRLRKLAPSGASNIVPSDGFPMPTEIAELVYNRGFGPGSVAGRCRRMPVNGKLSIPLVAETSRATGSRWGGVQVYRRNEGDTVTAKKPKFDYIEMEPESLMGLCYVTEEMLQDQSQIEGVFTTAFSEEFAFKVDDEIINGNGAAQFLGILNAPALVSVSKETGQAAATIVYQNLVKMFTRMPAGLRRNAVWLVNQDVEPQLWAMEFPVGTGGVPAFLPPGGAADEPFARLFGRPIIPIEQCATLGTVGDILLVDLNQYLIISKGGVQGASSMHVRFLYNEMTYRWTMRNNGQPTWKSAITPYKGTSTVSPFIALATRA